MSSLTKVSTRWYGAGAVKAAFKDPGKGHEAGGRAGSGRTCTGIVDGTHDHVCRRPEHRGVCPGAGDIAIVPPESTDEFKTAVCDALGVTLVETTIQGSSIIGSLVAGNSRGVVVSGLATEEEIDLLAEHREVLLLNESMNAAGT